MLRLLTALLLVAISTSTMAKTPGAIASLCKKQWPGQKGQQSYCIKEKRNYQDWLKYKRKRVFAKIEARMTIDECIADHEPDYRAAYDCVTDPSFF